MREIPNHDQQGDKPNTNTAEKHRDRFHPIASEKTSYQPKTNPNDIVAAFEAHTKERIADFQLKAQEMGIVNPQIRDLLNPNPARRATQETTVYMNYEQTFQYPKLAEVETEIQNRLHQPSSPWTYDTAFQDIYNDPTFNKSEYDQQMHTFEIQQQHIKEAKLHADIMDTLTTAIGQVHLGATIQETIPSQSTLLEIAHQGQPYFQAMEETASTLFEKYKDQLNPNTPPQETDRSDEKIEQLVNALNDTTGNKNKNMLKDHRLLQKEFGNKKGTRPLNNTEKTKSYSYIDTLPIDKTKKKAIKNAINQNYYKSDTPQADASLETDRSDEKIEQLVNALNDTTGNKNKNMPKDHRLLQKEFGNKKGTRPLNDTEKAKSYNYIDTLPIDKTKKTAIKKAINKSYYKSDTPQADASLETDRSDEKIEQLVNALNDTTGNKNKNMPKDYILLQKEFGNKKGTRPLNDTEKTKSYSYIDTLPIDKTKKNAIKNAINQNYYKSDTPQTDASLETDRSDEKIEQLVNALNDTTGNKNKNMPKDYILLQKEFGNKKGTRPLNDTEKTKSYSYIDTLPIDKTKKNAIKDSINQSYYKSDTPQADASLETDRSDEKIEQLVNRLKTSVYPLLQ